MIRDKEQLCDEIGADPVTDINLCKTAIKKIKYHMPDIYFKEKDTSSSYPKGCYLYTNSRVYFNPHHSGSGSTSARQICKKSNGKFKQ